MNKSNALVVCAHARLSVNKTHTLALQLAKGARQIRDRKCQMMNSRAAFGYKTRDGGIIGSALQQLDAAIAQMERGHAHLLVPHRPFRTGGFADQLLKDGYGTGEGFHCDSQVVNLNAARG